MIDRADASDRDSALYSAVRAVAAERRDSVAIRTTWGGSASYGAFIQLSDRIAAGLAQRGINSGDTIACVLRNSIDYAALIVAVARLGAAYVPLMQNFNDAETAAALEAAGPRLLVEDGHRKAATGDLPAVRLDALTDSAPLAAPRGDTAATGLFRKLWSSGSTGFPKLIAWRQDKFVHERRRWIQDTGILSCDIFFCRHTLDVAHATDLHLFAALLSGAQLVLADPEAPAAELLQQISACGATAMSALPRHYEQLVGAARQAQVPDLSAMRRPLCGGTYLSPATVRDASRLLGINIRQIYGSTEFGLALGDMRDRVQADLAMSAVRGVETRLAPLSGADRQTGEEAGVGELVLRSDYTSEGYLNNDTANTRTFRDGDFWTGDLARRQADGNYRILGRASETLATEAGPMPAPMLDEHIAELCPHVESVTLAADPDQYSRRAVVALRRPAEPEGEEKALAAIDRLFGEFGIEGEVRLLDTMPYTPVGKPDKPQLRRLCGL